MLVMYVCMYKNNQFNFGSSKKRHIIYIMCNQHVREVKDVPFIPKITKLGFIKWLCEHIYE
jgi:hypothetical protein